MILPSSPDLKELSVANDIPKTLPPLEGYTFQGFRNEDGSVGTKNILGITTSVQCVVGVLDFVVNRIKKSYSRSIPMLMMFSP